MNRVRETRKSRGMTLRDIATQAGVSVPFLSDVERGRRGAKDDTWRRLAEALGTTVTEIKGDETDEAADR